MTRSEIISNSIAVLALIVASGAWWTADTHASELRAKVIRYSVEPGGFGSSSSYGTHNEEQSESESVDIDIANDGSLPVNGVTISISTDSDDGKLPKSTVELTPAADREIVEQGKVLVVRLKNPLGPADHLRAAFMFSSIYPAKAPVHLKLGQAYVDSEVGAAILVASLNRNAPIKQH